MLKNNKYYYEDKYMYFTFGNIHSSKYNLFMVNGGDNLKFINNANSSSQFVNPQFQDRAYYTGTNSPQKTFPLDVAAEGLTLPQYKEMMLWLEAGTLGFLMFDSDPYWGWDVVLEKADDATYYEKADGTLIVQFKLTFKTVGTHNARGTSISALSVGDVNDEILVEIDSTSNNEYHVPEIIISNNCNLTIDKNTLITFWDLDILEQAATENDTTIDWEELYGGWTLYTVYDRNNDVVNCELAQLSLNDQKNWISSLCDVMTNREGVNITTIRGTTLGSEALGLRFQVAEGVTEVQPTEVTLITGSIYTVKKYTIPTKGEGTPLFNPTTNWKEDFTNIGDTDGCVYYLPCVSNRPSYITYSNMSLHTPINFINNGVIDPHSFSIRVNDNLPILQYSFNEDTDIDWLLSYDNDSGAVLYNHSNFVENTIVYNAQTGSNIELTTKAQQNDMLVLNNMSPTSYDLQIYSVQDSKIICNIDIPFESMDFIADEYVYICYSIWNQNLEEALSYNTTASNISYDYNASCHIWTGQFKDLYNNGFVLLDSFITKANKDQNSNEYVLTHTKFPYSESVGISPLKAKFTIGKCNKIQIIDMLNNPSLQVVKYNNL